MKKGNRYDTSQLIENQYEEGSHNQVLKNLRGIRNKRTMEQLETHDLLRATDQLIDYYNRDHSFTANDICHMHKVWLGSIYEWAGSYRQVFISKEGFSFAAPAFIPRLMEEFERDILNQYTPCTFTERNEVIRALAIVHTELLLIHPFREGNGRIARLLATLMGLQAGLPFLDFSDIEGEKKDAYFVAVRAGLDRNYKLMGKIFTDVILRSLKSFQNQ
jgi:cell filamentation protein